MTDKNETFQLKVKGRSIRMDDRGLMSLNDIHSAGGFTTNQKPHDWMRLETTLGLAEYTLKQITGKSRNWAKSDFRSVSYTKVGVDGGTWAHPNLALAYAKYLSPSLHYEVNEVFLRYKQADPKLADEILDKASPEDNGWAGVRALGRAKRSEYTKTLQDHGVAGSGYGACTNAIYSGLFNRDAQQLKSDKSLKKSASLRDAMSTDELVFTMAAETLAKNRISHEDARGNDECRKASLRSAGYIRKAIEANTADSQVQDSLPGT